MLLYFKKRKFRKFIRECGILEKIESATTLSFPIYDYIRKGLYKWEKEILRDEIMIIEQGKEGREMEKSRKQFFDTWSK